MTKGLSYSELISLSNSSWRNGQGGSSTSSRSSSGAPSSNHPSLNGPLEQAGDIFGALDESGAALLGDRAMRRLHLQRVSYQGGLLLYYHSYRAAHYLRE